MKDVADEFAVTAGLAINSALTEGGVTGLKEHIRERLTDSQLAHCQYYWEDEIIRSHSGIDCTKDCYNLNHIAQ